MTYTVTSGAWHKSTEERSSCPGPNFNRVGRKRKKKTTRSYNHYCVNVRVDSNGNITGGTRNNQDDLKYSTSGGHHPCKGLGSSTLIGGGTNSRGNWNNYTGKSEHYDNAEFAFKCSIPDSRVAQNIKAWSTSPHMTTARVKEGSSYKNLWEQIIKGVRTTSVNSSAFCEKLENLTTVVHNDGRTCYDMIGEALKKSLRVQHCANNPNDERCACYNISKHATRGCLENANKNKPGCKEVVAGFNKYPAAAVTEFDVKNFETTCFATGICSRPGQYLPENQPNACNQTIAVCKQEAHLYGDITGGAVTVDQSMDCKAESSAPASSGTGAPPAGAPPAGAPPAEEETGINAYVPKSLDDLKTNRKKQIGVGAVGGAAILSCLCVLLIILASSGGATPRRYR